MITHFVSGPKSIRQFQFNKYFAPRILSALEAGDNFVMADNSGVDHMAQCYIHDYFIKRGVKPPKFLHRVTIYHTGRQPTHNMGFRTVGGFKTCQSRDTQLTRQSDTDILWYHPLLVDEHAHVVQNENRRN